MPNGTPQHSAIWLRNNPRIRSISILLAIAGIGIASLCLVLVGWPVGVRLAIGTIAVIDILMAVLLASMNYGARVVHGSDLLWIRFGAMSPFPVPIDIVEAILRSQEPLPSAAAHQPEVLTSNVMIRIAEKAADWHSREIPSTLGRWCGGYVVLRGLWCQPITAELLIELNQRLVNAKRDLAAGRKRADGPDGVTRA